MLTNNCEKSASAQNESLLIPNDIHFVWFGRAMPAKNLERVFAWQKMHPNHTVTIWIDKTIDPIGELVSFEKEMRQKNILVKDITEEGVINECVRHELDKKYPNYGMASDMARIAILKEKGGIYLDSDVTPTRPLWEGGTKEAPRGILFSRSTTTEKWGGKTRYFFCNDFICAVKESEYITKLNEDIQKSYIEKAIFDYDFDNDWDSYFADKNNTLNTTGPHFILNKLTQDNLNTESNHSLVCLDPTILASPQEIEPYYINQQQDASWLKRRLSPSWEGKTYEQQLEKMSNLLKFMVKHNKKISIPDVVNCLIEKRFNAWEIASNMPTNCIPDSYLLLTPNESHSWQLFYINNDGIKNEISIPKPITQTEIESATVYFPKLHAQTYQVIDPYLTAGLKRNLPITPLNKLSIALNQITNPMTLTIENKVMLGSILANPFFSSISSYNSEEIKKLLIKRYNHMLLPEQKSFKGSEEAKKDIEQIINFFISSEPNTKKRKQEEDKKELDLAENRASDESNTKKRKREEDKKELGLIENSVPADLLTWGFNILKRSIPENLFDICPNPIANKIHNKKPKPTLL